MAEAIAHSSCCWQLTMSLDSCCSGVDDSSSWLRVVWDTMLGGLWTASDSEVSCSDSENISAYERTVNIRVVAGVKVKRIWFWIRWERTRRQWNSTSMKLHVNFVVKGPKILPKVGETKRYQQRKLVISIEEGGGAEKRNKNENKN